MATDLSTTIPILQYSAQKAVESYLDTFCNKFSLHHQAKGLASHVLFTPYSTQEESFERPVSDI